MTEFKNLMDQYVKVSSQDDMERLVDVLDHLFHYLMENNSEVYNKFITKVKLSNKHIPWDRQQAEKAVKCMKNKDGTTGEHWNWEQTTDVLHKKGLEYTEATWYVALNMVYSDYMSQDMNLDSYIRLACDFLDDEDAPDHKMKVYWVAMNYA
jgi:hypothetical protein